MFNLCTCLHACSRLQEQLVFEQLSGLVRDAAWFKSYMAAAMLVMKEAMQVGGGWSSYLAVL